MNQSDIDILNITQQVLRHFLIAIAAGNKSNLGAIGTLLQSAADNEALEPMARRMLADLAAGALTLHAAGSRKN